jgi:hypothetical protein
MSYTAWWNRVEKYERKFYHTVEKERIDRESKKQKIELKKKEK